MGTERVIAATPVRRSVAVVAVLLAAGCGSGAPALSTIPPVIAPGSGADPGSAPGSALPGMPPVTDPGNVYAAVAPGMLSPAAARARPLVYVPDARTGEVTTIDPVTFAVVGRYRVGRQIQHIVPGYDMTTLWATDDNGGAVVPFDPVTGLPGRAVRVGEAYNLYFTPDGRSAITVAEAGRTLVFLDPRTWQRQTAVAVPGCAGIDHADFTADGRTAVFSCEFAGRVAVLDVASRRLLRTVDMPVRNTRTGPQDIRLSPDGTRFYVADSDQNGLWVLDAATARVIGEIPTGRGPHGLYFDRSGRRLFVSNRLEGTVSVLDANTGAPLTKWKIPGTASPDMGGLSADGTQLWLSGRYDRAVYVLSTVDGRLIRRIDNVGREPHGLTIWPQPGRYSLGHTAGIR